MTLVLACLIAAGFTVPDGWSFQRIDQAQTLKTVQSITSNGALVWGSSCDPPLRVFLTRKLERADEPIAIPETCKDPRLEIRDVQLRELSLKVQP